MALFVSWTRSQLVPVLLKVNKLNKINILVLNEEKKLILLTVDSSS